MSIKMVKITNALKPEELKVIKAMLAARKQVAIPVQIEQSYHYDGPLNPGDNHPNLRRFLVDSDEISVTLSNKVPRRYLVPYAGLAIVPFSNGNQIYAFVQTERPITDIFPFINKALSKRVGIPEERDHGFHSLTYRPGKYMLPGYSRFNRYDYWKHLTVEEREKAKLDLACNLLVGENTTSLKVMIRNDDVFQAEAIETYINEYLLNLGILIDSILKTGVQHVRDLAASVTFVTKAPLEIDPVLGPDALATRLTPAVVKQHEEKKAMVTQLSKAVSVDGRGTAFDLIGGCYDAKLELLRIVYGLKNPEAFSKWGADFPKGILLAGPPGTGKTILVKAIAATAGIPVYQPSAGNIFGKFWGESEQNIVKLFTDARKHAPSIVLFDEIDALCFDSEKATHEFTATLTNTILSQLDGLEGLTGTIVIGTTNRPESMDKAFLRPGRFDKQLLVPLPDFNDRVEIWLAHLRGKRTEPNINYGQLATVSAGMSGAEIYGIVKATVDKKVNSDILSALRRGGNGAKPISTNDILETVASSRPGASREKVKQKGS